MSECQNRIVAAATLMGGIVFVGTRHMDLIMLGQMRAAWPGGTPKGYRSGQIQGFIDNFGKFHNRVEALAIATAAGQINVVRPKTHPTYELFSEDLY
jgi:hypothetical protein